MYWHRTLKKSHRSCPIWCQSDQILFWLSSEQSSILEITRGCLVKESETNPLRIFRCWKSDGTLRKYLVHVSCFSIDSIVVTTKFYFLQLVLPDSFTRKDDKIYEEVTIPPSDPAPVHIGKERIAIASLDEVRFKFVHQ